MMEKQNPALMNGLDEEWMELILTARKLEISIEEIRAFLKSPTHTAGKLDHLMVASQEISSHKASPCNASKGVSVLN
jgi:DNA-binding transcriptional MerR regulator